MNVMGVDLIKFVALNGNEFHRFFFLLSLPVTFHGSGPVFFRFIRPILTTHSPITFYCDGWDRKLSVLRAFLNGWFSVSEVIGVIVTRLIQVIEVIELRNAASLLVVETRRKGLEGWSNDF